MSKALIHAADPTRTGRKTVTALCGKRVSVKYVLSSDRWKPDDYPCLECRKEVVRRRGNRVEI
jgi:hypothetical protein